MIEAGEVFVPENADWIDLFVREMAQFPDGAHDDQVDALTQYLRWVKTKRTRFGSKKVGSMG
jgi:Phage-related terminase